MGQEFLQVWSISELIQPLMSSEGHVIIALLLRKKSKQRT